MNAWMETRDAGFIFAWSLIAGMAIGWIIMKIRDRAFESGYWKGRAVGWQMHRRLTQIQHDVDEVFNYDDYN